MDENTNKSHWWEKLQLFFSLSRLEKQVEIIRKQGVEILEKLEKLTKPDTDPVTAKINMEGTNMADISVPDTTEPLNAVVSFADVHGHATSPNDVPQWSSSDPSVATVDASADPDGLAAVVTILGPGATVIGVSSAGADGNAITAAGTVTVTSGPATSGSVEFDVPEAPPVEEPPIEEPPVEEPPVEEPPVA
jgi:hypothetical protein